MTRSCCHWRFRSDSDRCHRRQQPSICLAIISQSFHRPSNCSSSQPSVPSKLRMQSRTAGAAASTELRSQSDLLQPPRSDAPEQAPIQHAEQYTQISDAIATDSLQTRPSRDGGIDDLVQTDPACQLHSSGLPEMSLRPGFREHDGDASPAEDAQANATSRRRSSRRKGRKGKLKALASEAADASDPKDAGRQQKSDEPDAAENDEEAETQAQTAKNYRCMSCLLPITPQEQ